MKLSIVVPCYNEAKDILNKSNIILEKMTSLPIESELILVNDGSKDKTAEVMELVKGAIHEGYDINRGKGGAVKHGIEVSTGDYVLFMDADLSTDLSAIDTLIPLMGEYDLIIGSRHHKDSVIPVKQPLSRRFIGWCCRHIVNMHFHFHYSDTQCGFKAIKREVAKDIASKQQINGFAFDVEYLYIAKLNNHSIKEIPVIWRDDRGSTVSPVKSSIKFFKDIFKIKRNKRIYLGKEKGA